MLPYQSVKYENENYNLIWKGWQIGSTCREWWNARNQLRKRRNKTLTIEFSMQQHQGRTLYIHNESLMRHFKDAMRWCWKLWGEGRFIDPLKDLSQLALVPLSLSRHANFLTARKAIIGVTFRLGRFSKSVLLQRTLCCWLYRWWEREGAEMCERFQSISSQPTAS